MAAHYYVNRTEDGEPPRRRSPIPHAEDAVAIVPFVPWRCPSCGDSKPRHYGQEGRVRYHECRECGLRYRSIELPPSEIEHPALPKA